MGRLKQLYYDFLLLDSGALSIDEFKNNYGNLPVALLTKLREEYEKVSKMV